MKLIERCEHIGIFMGSIEVLIHRDSCTLILLELSSNLISHCLRSTRKSLTNLLGTEEFNKRVLQEIHKHFKFEHVIVGFTSDHLYRDDGFFEYTTDDKFKFIGKTEDDVLTKVMYNSFL